jgi:hypothetical protein
MAHEILHGHFSAFYWGQNYGGGEPYVVAAIFGLFGQSTFTLGLTPVLLAGVAALLVWRIGLKIFSPRVAISAGLIAWIWPEVFIWQSTLEYGFRFVTLDVGLGGVLLALDLLAHPSARRRILDASGIGVLFGLGWWSSPEIAYFAIPVALVILVDVVLGRLSVRLVEVTALLASLVVGALPWIVANLASGGASLHSGPQPDPTFTGHLEALRAHVVPIYLNLALTVSGRFILPHLLGRSIEYGVVVLAMVVGIDLLRRRSAWVLVAMAVVFPFVYAASPATWYWQDGRYAIYLVPTAALFAAAGVDAASRWAFQRRAGRSARGATEAPVRLALGLLVVVALVGTVLDARLSPPFHPGSPVGPAATWSAWTPNATGYASVLDDDLRSAHITDVIAGYWVAAPVAFASNGSIAASDVRYDRQPTVLAAIERRNPAYLFVRPERRGAVAAVVGSPLLDPGCAVVSDRCLTPGVLSRYLVRHHVTYREVTFANFIAVEPDRAISVDGLFAYAGIPT